MTSICHLQNMIHLARIRQDLYSQSLNLHETKYEHFLSPSLFIVVGNSAASLRAVLGNEKEDCSEDG